MDKPGILIKLYRIMKKCYNHKLILFSKAIYYFILIVFNCVIPQECEIGEGSRVTHPVGIVLHPDTILGKNAVICQNVSIVNARVEIGDNTFLGTGCVIIGPCSIGSNVKIGANTVVNFDVPQNVTVVGDKGHIVN